MLIAERGEEDSPFGFVNFSCVGHMCLLLSGWEIEPDRRVLEGSPPLAPHPRSCRTPGGRAAGGCRAPSRRASRLARQRFSGCCAMRLAFQGSPDRDGRACLLAPRLAEAALRLVLAFEPAGGRGSVTPARRAFDKPIAIACFVDRAPCLPFRMCSISSRTNSPACVLGAFP